MIRRTRDDEGGTITFSIAGFPDITIDTSRLPEGVRDRAVLHGISQRVGDSAAGLGHDLKRAHATMQSVVDRLMAGEWGTERVGEGRATDVATAVAEYFSEAGKAMTPSQASEALAALTKEQRASIRRHPEIARRTARLAAERAAAKADKATTTVDLSALFPA
jgi:hypothetical protein